MQLLRWRSRRSIKSPTRIVEPVPQAAVVQPPATNTAAPSIPTSGAGSESSSSHSASYLYPQDRRVTHASWKSGPFNNWDSHRGAWVDDEGSEDYNSYHYLQETAPRNWHRS